MEVRLGGIGKRSQAQLDGFKSRALKAQQAPVQHHAYTTEWRGLDVTGLVRSTLLVVGERNIQVQRKGTFILFCNVGRIEIIEALIALGRRHQERLFPIQLLFDINFERFC